MLSWPPSRLSTSLTHETKSSTALILVIASFFESLLKITTKSAGKICASPIDSKGSGAGLGGFGGGMNLLGGGGGLACPNPCFLLYFFFCGACLPGFTFCCGVVESSFLAACFLRAKWIIVI